MSAGHFSPCRDDVRILRLITIPLIVNFSVLFLKPFPEVHARRVRIVVVRQMHRHGNDRDNWWNCSVHNRGEQYYIKSSRVVCLIRVKLVEALSIFIRVATLIFSAFLVAIQVHELISQVHSRIHWVLSFFLLIIYKINSKTLSHNFFRISI